MPKKPNAQERILRELLGPDPPPTRELLLRRVKCNTGNLTQHIRELISLGKLREDQVPWRKVTDDQPKVAETVHQSQVIADLRSKLDKLALQKSAALSTSREQVMEASLVRILQAAGQDLASRAMKTAFTTHDTLISEAQHESTPLLAGPGAS